MYGQRGGAGVHVKSHHPRCIGAEGHSGRPVCFHSPDEGPGPATGNTPTHTHTVAFP